MKMPDHFRPAWSTAPRRPSRLRAIAIGMLLAAFQRVVQVFGK